MSRRYLALALPDLTLDRLRRQHPALAGQPFAAWASRGPRRWLTAVAAPGLQPGQAVADAQAIHPGLLLFEASPAADAALLTRLALWAMRFTPLAAVDGTDGLMLDVTGVAGLFGGEAALLAAVERSFAAGGYRVRGAIAGAPGTAAALASAAGAPCLLPGEAGPEILPAVPLAALGLPPATLQGLARLGLHSLGDALRQPRAPLARRFGRPLLDALDDATGARPRPIHPLRPLPDFMALRDLLEPITTRPAIDRVLAVLLDELCAALAAAGQGARQWVLRAFRVDRAVQELAIGTGTASHSPAHLARLFALKLDRLMPELGFERMVLEATGTEPLAHRQAPLHTGPEEAGADLTALAELLDRAAPRVALSRPLPLDSHWPEYAAAPAAPQAVPVVPTGWGGPIRPVRLLAEPLPVTVTMEEPGGVPLQLLQGTRRHRVLAALGPERLEPEWWGEDAHRPARDYYRLQTAEGPRLWVCRLREGAAAPRWFLHGELA
ncbi:Y-family DNA polymerase [Teichococcus aestuarii]|uniref:Y-family DNA polymerase n=1 Tax=Teichococcus aestuarii TaxID=568898 RepID=UPI0036084AE2